MSDLNAFKVKDSFEGLLHMGGTPNEGLTSGFKRVYDGDGTPAPFRMKTDGVDFDANSLTLDGLAVKAGKDNFASLTDPTTSNDTSQGYTVGSIWINTAASPRKSFICVDNTTSAAIWIETTNRKFNSTGSNPGSSNDNTQGYTVGSLWLNSSTNNVFMCKSSATGAAVWINLTSGAFLTNAGDPNGSITGSAEGQFLFDTTNNIPYWYSGAGTVWFNAFGRSRSHPFPVGFMSYWAGITAPSGALIRDGAAYSRTTYADLYALLVTSQGFTPQTFTVTIASPGVFTKSSHGFQGGERLRLSTTGSLPTGLNTTADYFAERIDANTFYLCSDELLTTRINTSGAQSGTHSYLQSLYGLGDGSTTFNVPNDLDYFIRSSGTGRTVGTAQNDAMQGHFHNFHISSAGRGTNTVSGNVDLVSAASSGTGPLTDRVRAPITDGTNGTPRTASETRPKNRAYLPIIYF